MPKPTARRSSPSLDDCYFYHTMQLPSGDVRGEWDIAPLVVLPNKGDDPGGVFELQCARIVRIVQNALKRIVRVNREYT